MTKPTAFDFEKAIVDLEVLVEKMSNEDLSLEASLQYFEQGVTLTKKCQQALQEAEQKIEIISNQLAEQSTHSDQA